MNKAKTVLIARGRRILLDASRPVGTLEMHYFRERKEAEAFASLLPDAEGITISIEKAGYKYMVLVLDNRISRGIDIYQ